MLTNYKHTQPTLHQVIPWFTKVKYFIHFFADLKICENTNSIRVMLQEHNQNRKKNKKKDGKHAKKNAISLYVHIKTTTLEIKKTCITLLVSTTIIFLNQLLLILLQL